MIQALLYCIALLLLEYSVQLLRNVCRPLKMSVLFSLPAFSITTGSRKKRRTPSSLSTRQVWRCGCWPATRWRRRRRPATPASCFTATRRSWSWPPNALRSRASTMSCSTWAGLSWGSTEAWPGTPPLGVCVFVIDGVRIPACQTSVLCGFVTSNGFCTAWCVTGLLLVQFIRWLYWLRSDHRRSHPLRGDEARPGGLELRELQRDLPRNLPQLQRRALLSNGATPESAGTNRRHRCSLWAYRTGVPVETQTSKWWSSCWCPLCVSRLWSWSKPPRSTRSHWPLEMELMMSAWSSRPTLASVSPRYLPVKWPHINTFHNLLSLYLHVRHEVITAPLSPVCKR